MELKPGLKLKAPTTTAEFIVIRTPGGDLDLTCAGAPLTDAAAAAVPDGGVDEQLLIGKRYSDEDGSIELLCTHSGAGPLLLGGQALATKAAKALPSSD